ncbi:uncharacterized protein RCC_04285 [Ramularia collo-cygni]|uniref:Uncharacterized protein n=1 Tax=Ramularia collo-cygni TaxID=112498 RepID=A0A2D3UZ05_9PEZI|nr:uncharacterized protein RCC_04285 [Ramularia collo-cygni]CZT18440.1 uncharacterized protein RCC_04285 [Ramularia collo-cygni]
MHITSILALALSATAASATTWWTPANLQCPDAGTITRAELIAGITGPVGELRETSANNLATKYCGGTRFRGIPLYFVTVKGANLSYAYRKSTDEYWYCSATNGRHPSGWPNVCADSGTLVSS